MEPVLYTFYAPRHELELVGRHVVQEGLADRLKDWRKRTKARELVYLATCQRVIWMVWDGDGKSLGLDGQAQSVAGEAAWRHLLGLATGLESANVGDREIPGQIRNALDAALDAGTAGEEALTALEDILREAHRLRARIGLDHGHASVASVALRHVERFLEKGKRVALAGVGPMTQYLAQRLPERGYFVTIANRTLSRAQALAEPLGLPAMELAELVRDPGDFDGIVTATAAPEPIFTLEAWQGVSREKRLFMLDLALPADSDPALEQLPWIHRLPLGTCLEETEHAKIHRKEAARQAEPLLTDGVERLQSRARDRATKRRRALAHEKLSIAWEALAAEAEEGSLGSLDPEQREALSAILHRGKTLAFRALAQSEAIPAPEESREEDEGEPA